MRGDSFAIIINFMRRTGIQVRTVAEGESPSRRNTMMKQIKTAHSAVLLEV